MAFLKEKLNAFIGQPVEKKRSDHRLKSVQSAIDSRSWVLDEQIKRQQFLNVVNTTGDGVAGGEGGEDEDNFQPIYRQVLEEKAFQLEDKIKELEEDKDFLKNIISDKENEIERLLFRIHAMAEGESVGVPSSDVQFMQNQLIDLKNQYNNKEKELKDTTDKLKNAEKMLKDLQTLVESTEDDPEKQKAQLDNVMKSLQTGMQNEIENLKDEVEKLEYKLNAANNEIVELKREIESSKEQIEALLSGDENELNKIIIGLRNELENTKQVKDAENKALKDIIENKDNELKNIKDMSKDLGERSQPKHSQDFPGPITDEGTQSVIVQRDKEINELIAKLDNEKALNKTLTDQLNLLAKGDESGLKNTILSLTDQLQELKSENQALSAELKEAKSGKQIKEGISSETLEPRRDPLHEEMKRRIIDVENMLSEEKKLNQELQNILQAEKDKLLQLASADDNVLKNLIANTEAENKELRRENKSLKEEIEQLKSIQTQDSPDVGVLTVGKSNIFGSDFQGDLDKITKENIDLRNENDSLKNKIKDLLNEQPHKISAIEHTLKPTIEVTDLKDENELINELGNLRAENKRLKDILKMYENKELKPADKLTKVQEPETIEPLKDIGSLQAVSDKNKELNAQNELLRNENEYLKKALKDIDNNAFQNKNILPETETITLGDDTINRDNFKIENDRLNNALKKEIDNNKMLQDKLNNLEKQNLDLRNENKSLKKPDDSKPAAAVDDSKSLTEDDTISNFKIENDRLNNALKKEIDNNKMLQDKLNNLEKQNLDLRNENKSLKKPDVTVDDSKPLAEDDTISQLKQTIATMKKEKIDLESQLQTPVKSTDPSTDDLMNRIKTLEKANNELTKSSKDEKDKCNESLLEKDKNIEKLKNEIKKLEKENEKLKEEINFLRNQLQPSAQREKEHDAQKCDEEKLNLNKENKELKDKIALLTNQSKLKTVDQPLSKSEADDISKLAGEVKDLTKENEKLNNEIKALKKKLDTSDKILNKEQDSFLKENEQLKKEVSTLQKEQLDLKNKLSKTEKEKEDLSSSAADGKKLLDENNKLKDELRELKEKLKALDKLRDKETIGLDASKQKEENEKLKETIRMLESKPDDVKVENQKLKKTNEKLMQDVEKLKNELREATRSPKDTVQPEKQVINDSKLLEENKKLEEKVKQLENEIKNSQGIDSKRKEPKAKSESDAIEAESVKNLKEDTSKLLKENKALKAEISLLKNKISEIEKLGEKKDEKGDLKKLKEDNLKLSKENDSLKKKILESERPLTLQKSETTSEGETKENRILKDKIKALEKENKETKSKLNDLNQSLATEVKNKLECEDENKRLLDTLNKLEKGGEISGDEVLNIYKDKADKLQKENEELKSKLSSLEKELKNIKERNAKLSQQPEKTKIDNDVFGKETVKPTPSYQGNIPSDLLESKPTSSKSPPDKETKTKINEPVQLKTAKSEKEMEKLKSGVAETSKTKSSSQPSTKKEEQEVKKPKPDKEQKEKIIKPEIQPDNTQKGKIGGQDVQKTKPAKVQGDLVGDQGVLKTETEKVQKDKTDHQKQLKPIPQKLVKEKVGEEEFRKTQPSKKEKDHIITKTKDDKESIPESKGRQSKPLHVVKEPETRKGRTEIGEKGKPKSTERGGKGIDTKLEKPYGGNKQEIQESKEYKAEEIKTRKRETTPKKIKSDHTALKPALSDERDAKTEYEHFKVKDGKPQRGAGKQQSGQEDIKTHEDLLEYKLEPDYKIKTRKPDEARRTDEAKKTDEHLSKKFPRKGLEGELLKTKTKESGIDKYGSLKKTQGRRRAKSLDLEANRKEMVSISGVEPDMWDERERESREKTFLEQMKTEKMEQAEQVKQQQLYSGHKSKSLGDKDYDNEFNKLKKKLLEAEQQITALKNEIANLKAEKQESKQLKPSIGDDKERYSEFDKYKDETTKKLNRILQKAIRSGLKALYLDELEYVHDSLNNTMAQRQGRPSTPGRMTTEDLENIKNVLEQRMVSLMRRLNNYRQHSSEQEKKIMDYSQKVQRLSTVVGLLEMKIESLQYETKQMRDLVTYEKEKAKKLEDMLKSVLDSCKCSRKWVLQQNYPGLHKT